jgi:hypothetical protein
MMWEDYRHTSHIGKHRVFRQLRSTMWKTSVNTKRYPTRELAKAAVHEYLERTQWRPQGNEDLANHMIAIHNLRTEGYPLRQHFIWFMADADWDEYVDFWRSLGASSGDGELDRGFGNGYETGYGLQEGECAGDGGQWYDYEY